MLIRAAHAETRLTDEEVIPKKPGRAFRVCGSPGGLFYRKAGGQAGWGIVTNGRDGALSEA
jgi:hypothetical protein